MFAAGPTLLLLLLPLTPLPPQEDGAEEPPEVQTNPWTGVPVKSHEQILAERESVALATVEQPLVREYFKRVPWTARELGYAAYDGHEGQFDLAQSARWLRLLADSSGELLHVAPHLLEPVRRVDHAWLASWMHAEILTTSSLPATRRDPAWYVEGVFRAIRSLAEARTPDEPERVAALSRRLSFVPDIWAEARRNLRDPVPMWTEHGIELAFDLVFYLEGPLEGAFAESFAGGLDPDSFHGPRREALEETREFIRWLEGVRLARDHRSWSMDPRTWEDLIQTLSGVRLTRDELKVLLLRDLARMQRQLGERVELEPTPAPSLRPPAVQQNLRIGLDGSRELAVAARLLAPGDPSPAARTRTAAQRGGPPLRRLPASGGDWILEVQLPADHWMADMRATRESLLSRTALAAAGVRHGAAGETGLYHQIARRETVTRGSLVNRCTVEGFGLYATDWVPRVDWVENPFRASEGVRAELVRVRLIEAARLYASLQLHGESLPPPDVVTDFHGHTGFDVATCQREILEIMRDPLRGIGYLGYREIRSLEEDLNIPSLREEGAIRLTRVTLTKNPCARVSDIRSYLSPR